MIGDLCKELNNWFDYKRIFKKFTITDGTIVIEEAQDGQYIRICDSLFNDGVYQYPPTGLTDETFDGVVWLMAVPKEVLQMSADYDEWKEKYSDILSSPYQSESFGGYSYTKATSAGNAGSGASGGIWDSPFAHEAIHYRKV